MTPETPYSIITFAIVVWNDAERLERLLRYVRPWFSSLAVAVQDSPDQTLQVASDWADIVVQDRHHGFGDASFGPKLLPRVRSEWTFKCDADEWPSEDLLWGLGEAIDRARAARTAGVWIPFKSWVEGIEYDEYHSHLRLFKTRVGWPGLLHSRPPIENGISFDKGHIAHARSLDEMMRDYLNYWKVGKGNRGWEDHNRLMMRSACEGVAAAKGWDFVQAHEWWPEVKAIAFEEGSHP